MDSLELDRSKGSLLPHTVVSAKQNVYFFSPVHFRECEIGYLVLENCDYLLDHQFLFETLNTFRTSIEALYGKLILRKKNKQLSQLYIHDSHPSGSESIFSGICTLFFCCDRTGDLYLYGISAESVCTATGILQLLHFYADPCNDLSDECSGCIFP